MNSSIPALNIFEHLPIFNQRQNLARAIQFHPIIIVGADTGSGKSTQLPKILLNLGYTRIGHTLPKRLAVQALYDRLIEEFPLEHHEWLGLQTRYLKKLPQNWRCKIMTDGILLAELASDPLLKRYQAVIIDEVHERSVTIDLILGCLKRIVEVRKNFRIILASASLDIDHFLKFFQHAHPFRIQGKSYPVEIAYRPWSEGQDLDQYAQKKVNSPEPMTVYRAIRDAIEQLDHIDKGDILIFLPGEREIYEAIDMLTPHFPKSQLLPLYARLPRAQQSLIFHPHGQRRLIFATNVAETSVTIPSIAHVIDTGMARLHRYFTKTQQSQLQIEPISQAAAQQRAGRCGRVKPGICIRLYSETDFQSRLPFTEPEMIRGNLSACVLKVAELGIADPCTFPFLNPPPLKRLNEAIGQLIRLKALASKPMPQSPLELTPLGRKIAKLPLDPPLGLILLSAKEAGLLEEVAVVVAALTIDSPFIYSLDNSELQKKAHQRFHDGRSDLLMFLKLWDCFQHWKQKGGNKMIREQAQKHFLHRSQLFVWQSTVVDLLTLIQPSFSHFKRMEIDTLPYDRFHALFLPAFLYNIARAHATKKTFQASFGGEFFIHPSSCLLKSKTEFIFCIKRLETSKKWGCYCAKISRPLIESVFRNELKWHYSDPSWDEETGFVECTGKATLLSLTIVAQRRCRYHAINPQECRALFIRHACIRGEWNGPSDFIAENQLFLKQRSRIFHKLREDFNPLDEEAQVEWFQTRLPENMDNAPAFYKWWKSLSQGQRRQLYFSSDPSLALSSAWIKNLDHYPDVWSWQHHQFPIEYTYDPSSHYDGITILLPQWQCEPALGVQFSWHLPIYQQSMVLAYLSRLPVKWRRIHSAHFESYAQTFLNAPTYTHLPFEMALYQFLQKEGHWRESEEKTFQYWKTIPALYRVKFRWVDDNGYETGFGEHWQQWPGLDQPFKPTPCNASIKPLGIDCALLEQLQQKMKKGLHGAIEIEAELKRCDLSDAVLKKSQHYHPCPFPYWDIQRHPLKVVIAGEKTVLKQVMAQHQSIVHLLFPYFSGLTRQCFLSQAPYSMERLRQMLHCKSLSALQQFLVTGLLTQCAQHYAPSWGLVWNFQAFETLKKEIFSTFKKTLLEQLAAFCTLLPAYEKIEQLLIGLPSDSELQYEVQHWLTTKFFPKEAGAALLWQMPAQKILDIRRYLDASVERILHHWHRPQKEDEFKKAWEWFEHQMEPLRRFASIEHDPIIHQRHKITLMQLDEAFNEFYISLFAQRLKTRYPISLERLEKMLKKGLITDKSEAAPSEKSLQVENEKNRSISKTALDRLKNRFGS